MRVVKFIISSVSPYKWYLLGIFYAIFIAAIDSNIKPFLIKLLIDSATNHSNYNIKYLVISYILMQLMVIIGWTISDTCAMHYSSRYRCHVMNIMTDKISKYSYNFFQNNLSGSIIAKINDGFSNIPNILVTIFHQFISFTLLVIISLFMLTKVNYLFSIAMLLWISIFLIITYISLKKVRMLTANYASSRAKIWGNLADYFGNIINVKFFSSQTYEITQLKKVQNDFIESALKQGKFLTKFYLIQGVIFSIYIVTCLLGLIYLHSRNIITSGDFAFVFFLNFKIVDNLYALSHELRDFIINWSAIDEALKILELPIEVEDKPNALNLVVNKGKIVFDKVKFSYSGIEELFEDKSLIIEPGEKIGLVGKSGGGKSTFINLILRLYNVTTGSILIDRENIQNVTQDSLRKNIAIIPQDPSLFHRSLMDNIKYGNLEATHADVIEAAKKAHAHEFIITLPDGYNSLVGERGVKLSGGQRQRIAIARAILKNAPILILDEATSQLDSTTEKSIQESLDLLMKGKTTIVIAHRLSTLLNMDRILVFDKGKIIQDGNHNQLVEEDGLYRYLWQTQIGGFISDN
ncbi:MAG: ABC transporter ATP-binding protein [Alphaproteobacteria bacterium]